MKKKVLRVSDVAADLFGDARQRWRVYDLIRQEKIPSLRIGKRTIYIPADRYAEWKREQGIERQSACERISVGATSTTPKIGKKQCTKRKNGVKERRATSGHPMSEDSPRTTKSPGRSPTQLCEMARSRSFEIPTAGG